MTFQRVTPRPLERQRPGLVNATPTVGERAPLAIVFAATTFNLALCFVNTHMLAVSAAHVIASELAILSAALICSIRVARADVVAFTAAFFFYLASLALLRAQASSTVFDVKTIRDFLIPIAFFLLGQRVSLPSADRLIWSLGALVTALALFEYFFTDVYLAYFDVIKYYVARGTVEAERLQILSTNLFVSGTRPEGEGRTLLPFLGSVRVSSLFLEPISMGNFGVIIFIWALARSTMAPRANTLLFILPVFFIVMSDSRFGMMLIVIAALVAALPLSVSSLFARMLPWGVMIGLIGLALYFGDDHIVNNFAGRLSLSGSVLTSFSLLNWFGAEESRLPTEDAGYAYVIRAAGLLGFAVAWYVFTALRGRSVQFAMFRNLTAFYFATLLCVSYSPFTIKTGALLWFLLGSLSRAPPTEMQSARMLKPAFGPLGQAAH